MRIHKPVREEELLKSGDRYSTIGGYTGARHGNTRKQVTGPRTIITLPPPFHLNEVHVTSRTRPSRFLRVSLKTGSGLGTRLYTYTMLPEEVGTGHHVIHRPHGHTRTRTRTRTHNNCIVITKLQNYNVQSQSYH